MNQVSREEIKNARGEKNEKNKMVDLFNNDIVYTKWGHGNKQTRDGKKYHYTFLGSYTNSAH